MQRGSLFGACCAAITDEVVTQVLGSRQPTYDEMRDAILLFYRRHQLSARAQEQLKQNLERMGAYFEQNGLMPTAYAHSFHVDTGLLLKSSSEGPKAAEAPTEAKE